MVSHGVAVRAGGAATWAWLALLVAAGCSELKAYQGDAAMDAADSPSVEAGEVGLDVADDAPTDTMDGTTDAMEVPPADAAAKPPADSVDATPDDAGEDAVEVSCDGSALVCGGACVDVSASVAHCGRCDNACPARANAATTCVLGVCEAACNAGFADCDGDTSNGCEASLEDAASCGRCGARCEGSTPLCGMEGGTRRCVSGCAAGEVRCGTSCAETASDAANCGACGNVCPMGAMCVASACACPSGQSNCGGACRETGASCTAGHGACLRTGAVVCAAMGTGTQCSATPGVAGAEVCNGVDDDCDGVVDGPSAAAACPPRANAAASCAMGACGVVCSPGFGDCDGDASNGCEADTRSALAHCGRCGNACAAGGACVEGACVRGCWRPMSAVGAPPGGRGSIDPVWTGAHVLIWGGQTRSGVINAGGLYDPLHDRWTAMTTTAALGGRHAYAGVWTGSRFVVYGGYGFGGGAFFYDGGMYDPVNDRWNNGLPISYRGAASPAATWTGSHMFVWSGGNGIDTPPIGELYDPFTGEVVTVASSGAPPGRGVDWPVAWSGTRVLIAGGGTTSGGVGAYDPIGNRWTGISGADAPQGRFGDAGVWTGSRFVVWGGQDLNVATFFNTGSMYDPTLDRWTPLSLTNAPSARAEHCMVWTGSRVLVWGGTAGSPLGDGAEFDPATNTWAPLPTAGAPTPRTRPRCVWTGREMVVWGGVDATDLLANGARYVPGCTTPPRYRSAATPRASDTGLVAHYEFEDDLTDSTRLYGDGAARGTVGYTTGRFGRALALDGTSSLVRLPDAPNWRELSVALYVRSSGTPRDAYIVNGWDVSREHFSISTWTTTSGVRMDGGNHPQVLGYPWSEVHARDPAPWVSDVWRHVAVTADASAVTLYVDGVEVSRAAQGMRSMVAAPQPLTGVEIGGSSRNPGIFFHGAIDDLRLYNRALSAAEVRALTGLRQLSCPTPSAPGCGTVPLVGGTFTLGQDGARGTREPVPGVSVSDFELDAAEVTVARFRRFWNAGHPGVPGNRILYREGVYLPWDGSVREPNPTTAVAECNWSPSPGAREDHPINCVDWYTAQAFCVWDGGRLPTEAEFEYAARTSLNSTYPWGEDPPGSRACWSGVTARTGTCAVGGFPATRGLFDLSGNLWERVADADASDCWTSGFRMRNPLCPTGPAPVYRAIRGGAYDSTNVEWMRGASRGSDPATGQDRNAGFRCAR